MVHTRLATTKACRHKATKPGGKQRRIQLVTTTSMISEKGRQWSLEDVDDTRRRKGTFVAKHNHVTRSAQEEKTNWTVSGTRKTERWVRQMW